MDEIIMWVAKYDDGSTLSEETGSRFIDIDRERLESIQLVEAQTSETILALLNRPGKTPIFRRRTWMDGHSGKVRGRAHLIGWVGGPYHWIFPDGTIVVADDFIEGHGLMYPVEFLPEEVAASWPTM